MIAYPDTSFLCSVYRPQAHSAVADAYRRSMDEPLHFTSLLEFEFLQSIRLQVFLHANDRNKGYGRAEADQMAADWQADVASGICRQVGYEAEAVNRLAQSYSELHTMRNGHRSLDVLHLATAVHLGARAFLTFDARQRQLAGMIGIRTPL